MNLLVLISGGITHRIFVTLDLIGPSNTHRGHFIYFRKITDYDSV